MPRPWSWVGSCRLSYLVAPVTATLRVPPLPRSQDTTAMFADLGEAMAPPTYFPAVSSSDRRQHKKYVFCVGQYEKKGRNTKRPMYIVRIMYRGKRPSTYQFNLSSQKNLTSLCSRAWIVLRDGPRQLLTLWHLLRPIGPPPRP